MLSLSYCCLLPHYLNGSYHFLYKGGEARIDREDNAPSARLQGSAMSWSKGSWICGAPLQGSVLGMLVLVLALGSSAGGNDADGDADLGADACALTCA